MEFLVEPVDIDLLAQFVVGGAWGYECTIYCAMKEDCTPDCEFDC